MRANRWVSGIVVLGFVVLGVTQPGSAQSERGERSRRPSAVVEIDLRLPATEVSLDDLMRVLGGAAHEAFAGTPDQTLSWHLVRQNRLPVAASSGNRFLIEIVGEAKSPLAVRISGRDDEALRRIVERVQRTLEPVAARDHTADEIRTKSRELADRQRDAEGKLQTLSQLEGVRGKLLPEVIAEQFKAAAREKQQLEMDLLADQARAAAIREQIVRTTKELEETVARDEVVAELRKAMELRGQQVDRVKAMFERGQTSATEVAAAEEDVTNIRVRILERQGQLRQEAGADLLGRLTSELATLMIDQAEAEARLAHVRQRMPDLDLEQMSERRLEEVAERYRELLGEHSRAEESPLYKELHQRVDELRRAQAALVVKGVRVREQAATAPASVPATSPAGRRAAVPVEPEMAVEKE